MTIKEKILDQLMTIKFATINNFYSPDSNTYDGSLLQITNYFNEFNDAGYIRSIDYDLKPRNRRKEVFYYITPKGAEYIGRKDEYKFKEIKAASMIRHESMKVDFALSMVRFYPDWEFDFDYNKTIGVHKPDIWLKMRHREKGTLYTYWVEIERKKYMSRDVINKSKNFKSSIKGDDVKCLFVMSSLFYDCLLRPQEYEANKASIEFINNQFKRMLKKGFRRELDNRFLFMNFTNFYRLNEAVWFSPDNCPRKLIQ